MYNMLQWDHILSYVERQIGKWLGRQKTELQWSHALSHVDSSIVVVKEQGTFMHYTT